MDLGRADARPKITLSYFIGHLCSVHFCTCIDSCNSIRCRCYSVPSVQFVVVANILEPAPGRGLGSLTLVLNECMNEVTFLVGK